MVSTYIRELGDSLAGFISSVERLITTTSNFIAQHWIFAIAILVALAAGVVLNGYRKWHQGWLSELVDQRIREIRYERKRDRIRSLQTFSPRSIYWGVRSGTFRSIQRLELYFRSTPRQLKDFYLPSLTSFSAISLVFLIVFLVPHYSDFGAEYSALNPRSFLKSLEHEDTAKKIFEGLIVVAVALIIFVAESIRDSTNAERKRVLLRISYLWPLTLAVTLFPLGYLAGELTKFAVLLLVAIAFSAIIAFAKIVRNLLDADAQGRNLRALLKDRIHSLVMDSVRERLGNNILLQRIGPNNQIKINYSLSKSGLEGGAGNYVLIEHPRFGWVSDINFDDLQSLTSLLQTQARRLGFEVSEEAKTVSNATIRSTKPVRPQVQESFSKKIYLLKRYREQLPPDSPFSASGRAILAIPKEFAADPRLVEEVRRRTLQVFRLTSAEPSSEIFRREMQGTKDQLVAAIRSVSLGAIDDLRQTYLGVAEEFLKILHQLGGGYSAEQARNERSNFFEGWNEIRLLARDVRELLIVSAETNNVDVIGDIAFLPFAIATRAVLARDHLLFEEFTPFASFIYSLGVEKPATSSAREFMIDRSWRYLKELCEFYVLPITLESGGMPVDLSEAKDFALYAFKVLQDILKIAFDKDDIKTFQTVLAEINRLFRNISPEQPSSEFLKTLLARAEQEKERTTLQERILSQEKTENSLQAISLGRKQLVFGLAAHILDKLVMGETEKQRFYEAIERYLPKTFSELAQVYEKISGLRSSDLFDWTRWDFPMDGEPHFVDSNTKPDRLFCVLALRLLTPLDADAKARLSFPPSEAIRSLLFRANKEGVPTVLDEPALRDRAILTPEQWQQIDTFKTLLQKSKEAVDRAEKDQLIQSSVDPEKLTNFIAKIVATRTEHGKLRQLFIKAGSYAAEPWDGSLSKIPSWGFNQLDDKGAFVTNYRVAYPNWGEAYGRGLAQTEDSVGFKKLLGEAATKLRCERDSFFSAVERAISDNGLRDPIVIHSLLSQLELSRQGDVFIARYRSDCPITPYNDSAGFSGVLKFKGCIVPVISLFVTDEKLKGRALVADLARFARWHQFSAADDSSEVANVHDSIFVRVTDLNVDNDLRETIIKDNPPYLNDENDKDRYLRTRVVVKVYERFELELLTPSAGVAVEILNSDEFD